MDDIRWEILLYGFSTSAICGPESRTMPAMAVYVEPVSILENQPEQSNC